jgi:nicotinamide-nucleotide amidase
MRVEIVAIGTELLLGQIADTNSQWLGEQLAAHGITSHFHQHVGDNHERIVDTLRTALSRSDAVITCGGLGPTQDDITRAAIAEIMGVPLERDERIVGAIRTMFERRGRDMPENNLLQAEVPRGATPIDQVRGTAPGLICPVGDQVIYAVPGVPYEMSEMFERSIIPDLIARERAAGRQAVITSRVLRTWGASESGLAEALAERIRILEGSEELTLAFLASGIEGIKVRMTARGRDHAHALEILRHEEAHVRAAIESAYGDVIFGVDDETMEHSLAQELVARSLTLAVAESVTGGLVSSRLVNVPGASAWYRGALVSYASDVKFDLLRVTPGPVVSATAVQEMADGVRHLLGSDVGLAISGVAGPESQDGQAPGTVFVGISLRGVTHHSKFSLPGDRPRIRQYSSISALQALRQILRQGW